MCTYSPASLPANRVNFSAEKLGRSLRLDLGFRLGQRGTHTSRTMMLPELTTVLAAVPATGSRQNYVDAVVESNCLRKPTTSTRRLTLQRLSELYGIDPDVPIFRVLRRLWIASSVSLQFLVTKPPEIGGFDEHNSKKCSPVNIFCNKTPLDRGFCYIK